MDLKTRKYEFIKKLFKLEEPKIMDELENILQNKSYMKSDSLESYNNQVNDANSRIDKGKFYTQDEVEKIAGKW